MGSDTLFAEAYQFYAKLTVCANYKWLIQTFDAASNQFKKNMVFQSLTIALASQHFDEHHKLAQLNNNRIFENIYCYFSAMMLNTRSPIFTKLIKP